MIVKHALVTQCQGKTVIGKYTFACHTLVSVSVSADGRAQGQSSPKPIV